MSAQRPTPTKPPTLTPLSAQLGGFFGKLFLLILIVGGGAFGVYAYGLNTTIVNKFENRRWDIPARVYSRPLVLEKNASISKTDVENWLKLLNYRNNDNKTAGTYHIDNNTYTIHTRGFHYGDDDSDNPQTLQIRFNNNAIVSLKSNVPNRQGFTRLEPVQIGAIYPDSNEDRVLIRLDDTPKHLIDALIATEDRGFYEHYGVSIRGTSRAILNNLRGGSRQGGSTLTQQLIKNFYLTSDRTLKRKVNEAIMALLLEAHYSKDDILQLYINEINLGQNGNHSINGFGIAAQFYFNRPLNELRLDQHALLVGLAKGSSYYNPRKHPERALERRNVVLHNMLVTGKISQDDYTNAVAKPLDIADTPAMAKPKFPDFLDYVQRELKDRYHPDDLKRAGLRIISTLDPLAQISADKAISGRLKKLSKNKKLQGALISANPHTGEVLALVGSSDEFTGFNRAIDAKRQVGSLLKPVIYLMALQSGEYNLASNVDDSEKSYKVGNKNWTPKNYGGVSYGDVPLTTALANSYNQAAVNTGMAIGLDHYIQFLKQMGIKDTISPYPSTLLGAVDLSPIQMLGLYQIFATGGTHYPLHAIDTVMNENGQILQKARQNANAKLPADAAYLTNYAMQQVIKDGTAKAAQSLGKDLNLAGKTGTTNDGRDAWFAGYSGNYVSIVWIGRDDNKPIGLTGGSGALPVWIDYMKRLKLTPVNLPEPSNIQWQWLEQGTGRATHESCPNSVYLPVLPESIPTGDSLCVAEQKEMARQAELAQKYAEETVSFDELDDTPSDESVTGNEFLDSRTDGNTDNNTADSADNANNPDSNE